MSQTRYLVNVPSDDDWMKLMVLIDQHISHGFMIDQGKKDSQVVFTCSLPFNEIKEHIKAINVPLMLKTFKVNKQRFSL